MGRIFFFAAALALWFDAAMAAEDATPTSKNWPQWRGPNAQGVSDAKGLPEKWSATENIKWKAELPGRGDSSPCVWGDAVFIVASVTDGREMPKGDSERLKRTGPGDFLPMQRYQFHLYRFNRLTGRLEWDRISPFTAGGKNTMRLKGDYGNATPATDGRVVCTSFATEWVFCYDIDGNFKWRRDLGDETLMDFAGDGNSTIIDGDRVIALRIGLVGSYVTAFDKETGKTLWQVNCDEKYGSWTTQVMIEDQGKRLVVTSFTERIRAMDDRDGNVVWECGGMTKVVVPTIVYGHGLVFAASGGPGNALAAIKMGRTGDLTGTDAVAWTYDKSMPYVPSPLLYGDELYVVDDKGILSCFEAATGKLRYDRTRIAGVPSLYASPVGAEGKIYVLGEDGAMVILKAGPKFEVLATNEIPERFHASPALVDGMILLRGDQHLFCISSR